MAWRFIQASLQALARQVSKSVSRKIEWNTHALRAALIFGPVPVPPALPPTSTVAVKVGA